MSELGKDFFIPEELGKGDQPAYLAGALCAIHSLAKRMEMLKKDGLWDIKVDNEIREQFQVIIDQVTEVLPADVKKNHDKRAEEFELKGPKEDYES